MGGGACLLPSDGWDWCLGTLGELQRNGHGGRNLCDQEVLWNQGPRTWVFSTSSWTQVRRWHQGRSSSSSSLCKHFVLKRILHKLLFIRRFCLYFATLGRTAKCKSKQVAERNWRGIRKLLWVWFDPKSPLGHSNLCVVKDTDHCSLIPQSSPCLIYI